MKTPAAFHNRPKSPTTSRSSSGDNAVADGQNSNSQKSNEPESVNALDEIILSGQPPLAEYLRSIEKRVVNGKELDRGKLVDAWREANDYYHQLEEDEAGIADDIEVLELQSEMRPWAQELTTKPRYTNTFGAFPTSFGMVELDRLVLYQTHVIRQFTDALREELGSEPNAKQLFDFCHLSEIHKAPVEIRELESGRYTFSSESTDFRVHQPVVLESDQIVNYDTFGPISGAAAFVIGFGSNFFTAIRYEDRILLHNGYHRAYAMRSQGITHAPCIIQTVTRQDEIEVAAKRKVGDDPGFYFGTARPPLLKDFFDPKIRKVQRIYRSRKVIEVELQLREYHVRDQ